MATESKKLNAGNGGNANKRKHYLPHNKPVKKGRYPLRPGVQGFFITCDGGRERQASHEAINVIDSFFEELVHGVESNSQAEISKELSNKKIKFVYSDSSGSEDDEEDGDDDSEGSEGNSKQQIVEEKDNPSGDVVIDANRDNLVDLDQEKIKNCDNQEADAGEPPRKKQCVDIVPSKSQNLTSKVEEKSIDKLIEAEIADLGDKSKRRFSNLDSGCNGVIFVQMHKKDGDPNTKDIVQYMMTSLASTRKHVSRFMLRVLPIELACYASGEEITRAIKPLIGQYFPVEAQNPHKFAVLYDARANTGIDRMQIINAVAKSVPPPHKVDLSNPDIHIVVQVVKTVCLIGVVEKYKELAKYNLRQLTSSK